MIERTFVEQGIKMVELEEMLRTELNKAGFTKAEIIKTPLVTRIVVNVVRPGLAIGKSGTNIKQLTEIIGKRFGINNPQLEIKEIERPELDALATVNKIKSLVERGYSWRSVAFRTMQDIQRAGAQGVELLVSGKLAGKGDRKRKQRISLGYMKKVGFQTNLVDFAKATAYTKSGAIGLKLKIVKPETVFPDKFNLKAYIEALKQKQFSQEQKTLEENKKPQEEKVEEKKENTQEESKTKHAHETQKEKKEANKTHAKEKHSKGEHKEKMTEEKVHEKKEKAKEKVEGKEVNAGE